MTMDSAAIAELEKDLAPAKGGKSAKVDSASAIAAVKKNTVRILLEDSEDIPPCGQYFGLNGHGYMLKTGVAADVPLGLKEILDNAVITVPIKDPQTNQVVGWRSRPKYNYRVIT